MKVERKTIYSREQQKKDERRIVKAENGESPLDLSAFKRLMVHDLCTRTEIVNSGKIGCYTLEEINRALANPQNHYSMM